MSQQVIEDLCVLLVLPAEGETLNLSKRLSWHDREGVVPTELPPFPMYTSAERHTALLLCGWNFGPNGQNLEDYLKRWREGKEEEDLEQLNDADIIHESNPSSLHIPPLHSSTFLLPLGRR